MAPTVNEMGRRLAGEFDLVWTGKNFRQRKGNCADIACEIVAVLGFKIPVYNGSTEIHSLLLRWKAYDYTGFGPSLPEIESNCFLVCRDSEDVPSFMPNFSGSSLKFGESNNRHVSVEHDGVDYNFGPDDDEGFSIVLKIPLLKA
jgi:hypothetical protein